MTQLRIICISSPGVLAMVRLVEPWSLVQRSAPGVQLSKILLLFLMTKTCVKKILHYSTIVLVITWVSDIPTCTRKCWLEFQWRTNQTWPANKSILSRESPRSSELQRIHSARWLEQSSVLILILNILLLPSWSIERGSIIPAKQVQVFVEAW